MIKERANIKVERFIRFMSLYLDLSPHKVVTRAVTIKLKSCRAQCMKGITDIPFHQRASQRVYLY